MKIKKLTAAAMAGIMVLGMGTSVYAETLTGSTPATNPQNVQAKYTATDPADIVYSVDISWGSMQYTYTVPSEGPWDPETHTFGNAPSEGSWSCEGDNAGEVKVTNHSNAAVKAAFSYTPEDEYRSVTGTFTNDDEALPNSELALETAVGTSVENAPADTVTLELNGALNKSVTEAATIGTVTVTLVTPDAV